MNNSIKDIEWLLVDAKFLFASNRYSGSLLMLLCAIQALSRQCSGENDHQRFENYLREKLPSKTRVKNLFIQIKKESNLMRLEEILYNYLRNPMIHQGKHLKYPDDSGARVSIDFSIDAASLVSDGRNLIIGGRWLCDVLASVIQDELGVPSKKEERPNL